jgi:hypothetical protein
MSLPQFAALTRRCKRGEMVTTPKSDKHKEYVRYAAHCLEIVPAATDQESHAVQREMAAEWLKLADTILHPSGPMKSK